jgi:hypothetical protein
MKFHGTVVATMYGTPSICMMPTSKNKRFLTDAGRPELIRHFEHTDLDTMVQGDLPDLIDPATIARLRADSRAGLAELGEAIRSEVRGRRVGAGR